MSQAKKPKKAKRGPDPEVLHVDDVDGALDRLLGKDLPEEEDDGPSLVEPREGQGGDAGESEKDESGPTPGAPPFAGWSRGGNRYTLPHLLQLGNR